MAKTIFDYQNRDVSITLTRKVRNKGDDIAPAFWRITYNRKPKYYTSGFKFTSDDWGDFVDRKLQKHKDTKITLKNFFDKTLRPIVDSLVEEGSFSFDILDYRLGKSDVETVNDAFKRKIEELKKENAIGNATTYRQAYTALMRYRRYKKMNSEDREEFLSLIKERRHVTKGEKRIDTEEPTINWNEISAKFLKDFDSFLQLVGLNPNTISIYMRTFRALINNKGGDPYIQPNAYPFGVGKHQYQIPTGHRVERSLRITDIRKIESFESKDQRALLARDIFMFMFYCSGINIGDLCRLRYSDIDSYTNEIIFKRKKTAKKVVQPVQTPLLIPMVRIISKWGNKDRDGYIFPFLNGCKIEAEIVSKITLGRANISAWIKRIGETLSLPDISTGTARNSYATYMLSEGVSRVFVDKQLGHYNKGDVLAGYANFTPEQRLQYNSLLLNEEDRKSKVITMNAI